MYVPVWLLVVVAAIVAYLAYCLYRQLQSYSCLRYHLIKMSDDFRRSIDTHVTENKNGYIEDGESITHSIALKEVVTLLESIEEQMLSDWNTAVDSMRTDFSAIHMRHLTEQDYDWPLSKLNPS